MFNHFDLYQILKPKNNPDFYTKYPIILGGTSTALNLNDGVWILNVIASSIETRGAIDKIQKGDKWFERQWELVKTSYQLDFYKSFDPAADFENVVQIEAMRMREWLKSVEVGSELKRMDAEIAPITSSITFSSEIAEGNFTLNRANFDFMIFSKQSIELEIETFDKIKLKGVSI